MVRRAVSSLLNSLQSDFLYLVNIYSQGVCCVGITVTEAHTGPRSTTVAGEIPQSVCHQITAYSSCRCQQKNNVQLANNLAMTLSSINNYFYYKGDKT